MSLLEFREVSFEAGGKPILQSVSLEVERGDFISVVGPSGSGKSTLLKLCSNLISPTSGEIIFDGENYLNYRPEELRMRIAYVFQTPYLFGETVRDNMEFPYAVRNRKYDPARVEELFATFQMSPDYLNREVQNLSGGEMQRISLIRSLLFLPEILLLDEATSALDVENAEIVEGAMVDLNREGRTILWITHNPQQREKYANRVLTLEDGRVKSLEEVIR
ncbi:MAG: ATP-binding cassette domain-containing protein [Tissierellia bacterium]|nr:ATP-binding cassette domain-containing protein [Tissierellia bacterium]